MTEVDAWAKDRALSNGDNRYFRASQALEHREVRQIHQQIEAKRQELEQMSQDAEIRVQKRKIRQRSTLATVTLVASLMGVAIAPGVSSQSVNARVQLDTRKQAFVPYANGCPI